MSVPARRRISSWCLIAGAATTALLSTGGAAAGDTGGRTLTYTTGHGWVATAAHPMRRSPVPVPRLPDTERGTTQAIVPSPDGRHLAQAFDFFLVRPHHLWLFTAVVVTDRHGGHQHVVWRETARSHVGIMWMQGMTWSADGRRLYFAPFVRDGSGHLTTRILQARIRTKSVGDATRVPGSTGLTWPSTDPTGSTLAAVRAEDRSCVREGRPPKVRSATLVVLDPKTGLTEDLTSVTTPLAMCATPIEGVAWSPDGRSIAFDTDWTVPTDRRETADVRVVSVTGPDHTPTTVVSGEGKHVVAAPAWQNATTLWFTRKPILDETYDSTSDLYSTHLEGGVFQPPIRRTHVDKYRNRVFDPSFG